MGSRSSTPASRAWSTRSPPPAAGWAGSTGSCSATRTRITAARRRDWARRSSATRPTGPTARATAGGTTSTSRSCAPYARPVFPHLLDLWDGGPVTISGTIEEGEDVSGFRAVHIPGHAPGLIALYRERDGLALTSDCFYTLDPQTGIHGPPRVPHPAFNLDTEQARASIRKLAELEPSSAWPGHAEPLTGDVAAQLERAAAAS